MPETWDNISATILRDVDGDIKRNSNQWHLWMFPKIGGFYPQNGWFILQMENPIKMDDLGVPLFLETPIYLYQQSYIWVNRDSSQTSKVLKQSELFLEGFPQLIKPPFKVTSHQFSWFNWHKSSESSDVLRSPVHKPICFRSVFMTLIQKLWKSGFKKRRKSSISWCK